MALVPNTATFSSGVDNKLKKEPSKTAVVSTNNGRRRRFLWRLRRNKRKLPTVRLGGQGDELQGEQRSSRSVMVRKMIKRIQVKWIKLKKAIVLRKLKEYYSIILKDLMQHDGGSYNEKHQQMLLMETSFAVPVMGMASFNSFR